MEVVVAVASVDRFSAEQLLRHRPQRAHLDRPQRERKGPVVPLVDWRLSSSPWDSVKRPRSAVEPVLRQDQVRTIFINKA